MQAAARRHRGLGGRAWALALCGWLACASAFADNEAAQWQALWSRLPPLPAQAAEAATMVTVRRVPSEGLGHEQLRVDVSDARRIALQRDIDRLFDITAQPLAAQMRRAIDAANRDPQSIAMARQLDELWKPDPARPDQPPSLEQLRQIEREVTRVLGPLPSPASAAQERAARSEIAAYRLELQRATPRAGQFLQRLADRQRQYARQHAELDRDTLAPRGAGANPVPPASTLVERHRALAQQQLDEANRLHAEALAALAPRAERYVELARAAEQRGAPIAERQEAYVAIKSLAELLLTLQRETLQDVGFWAGLRVAAPGGPLYELAQAPGFDLRADGVLPFGLPHYPIGRAIVLDRPPGIR